MSRTQTSDARRARNLALALAFVLGGTFLYARGVQASDAALQVAAASPTTYPSDSHGITTLAVTAPARERATAWTSAGARAIAATTEFGTQHAGSV